MKQLASLIATALLGFAAFGQAAPQTQPPFAAAPRTTVPRLVNFSATLKDSLGKPVIGPVSITFSLFAEQEGGSPLWSETQVVEADPQGHYSVFLGAMNAQGLPLELFTTGAARWLAVEPGVPAAVEPPRILLVGVPYALKAADADTLGGKPASAYVTVEQQATAPSPLTGAPPVPTGMPPVLTAPANAPAPCSSVTSDGAAATNTLALFTTPCNIESSPLYALSGKVGLGTTTPSAYLDIYPTTTSTANTQALRGSINVTPSASSSAIYEGVRGQAFDTGATNSIGQLKGFVAYTESGSNQNVGAMYGLFSESQVSKSGGYAVEAYGAYANAVETAGTLTTGYGLYAQAQGAMTTGYGVYSSVANYGSGKPTTGYGVYIAPLSVTGTSFGLYQGGSSDKNYFAGNVGVGTSTPSAPLEVNGSAKFDGAVTFAGGVTGNLSTGGQLISTVATGTAPLQVTSTTQVANLNASLLGGIPASGFASLGANTFSGNQTISGNLNLSGSISSALILQGNVIDAKTNNTGANVIGGYAGNAVTNGATGATIGGGGFSNVINSSYLNTVSDDLGTVSGGGANTAGQGNGNGPYATVGGGLANTASGYASTVSGGENATASGGWSAVLGGDLNQATGPYSAVVGGYQSTAAGQYSIVLGGYKNVAGGDYSFAAGQYATTSHAGAFLWCQGANPCSDEGANSFVVAANGPISFYDGSGGEGCKLVPGTPGWQCSSDRDLKDDIEPIDPRSVLERVAQMPVSRWSMKADTAGHKHIGPMAQDFYAAFGLGDSDKYIAQSDAQGVALAGIQGLYQLLKEKDEQIQALRDELHALEASLGKEKQ